MNEEDTREFLKQLMCDIGHRANVHEAAVLMQFECPEVGFVEFKKPEWRVSMGTFLD